MGYADHPGLRRTIAAAAARIEQPIRLLPHVALRPRRCGRCGKPVLLDFDDRVLDNDARTEHSHA